MKCSKCGKEIPVDTPPSEHWEYYCPKCGIEEVFREIRESKDYYDDYD
jgi:predicted RNA-binding Zn-ribbon protein involved in translation (DUF1610 family)